MKYDDKDDSNKKPLTKLVTPEIFRKRKRTKKKYALIEYKDRGYEGDNKWHYHSI